jgi:hypothetical protein
MVLSCVDTIVKVLLSQRVLLHFTGRNRTKMSYVSRTYELGSVWKERLAYLMSAMVKRRIRVQIMPRMSLRLPSMISFEAVSSGERLWARIAIHGYLLGRYS